MTTPVLILTHPGSAHADEMIACALMSASYGGLPIERRAPSHDDLESPEIIVLDQGLRWEADKLNFDHHQDHPLARGRCTTGLALEFLSGHTVAELYSLLPWLSSFECWDANGPGALGKRHGLSQGQTLALQYDPTGPLLRELFAEQTRITPEAPLGILLQAMGSRLKERLAQRPIDYATLSAWAMATNAADLPGLVFPPKPGGDIPPACLSDWIAEFHPDIAFYICPNRRGGTGINRWNDDARLDLSRLTGKPGVRFAHPGGFIAVVDGGVGEALELVAHARTGAV